MLLGATKPSLIPIQKMFVTDIPPAKVAHPPLGKGRVGEGSDSCVEFFFQIGITTAEIKSGGVFDLLNRKEFLGTDPIQGTLDKRFYLLVSLDLF